MYLERVCFRGELGLLNCDDICMCALSVAGVLWMSVVRGMRGVGGVCEMCMCLARGGEGGVWMRGLGLGFTNPVGTGDVLDVCVFWLR